MFEYAEPTSEAEMRDRYATIRAALYSRGVKRSVSSVDDEDIALREKKTREHVRPDANAHILDYHNYRIAIETGHTRAPSVRKIAADILSVSPYSWNDICSNRRKQDLVYWRQAIMHAAKNETPYSLPQIGRQMGGKDHTTVLHAIRIVDKDRVSGMAVQCTTPTGRVFFLRRRP